MKRFYSKVEKILSVDRSGLINKKYQEKTPIHKEHETEVGKIIKSKIHSIGPLSVATFMNEALLNPKYGYYYKDDNKIFGKTGDFITNPEISNLYGQFLLIWIYKEWENLGKPKEFNLIELGPGSGTLMKDILDSLKKFKDLEDCLKMIHFIDVSPNLIKKQIKKLLNIEPEIDFTRQEKVIYSNSKFCWNPSFNDIESDKPFILIAHEFFDALPIYQFYYTERGWREVLIDVDDSDDTSLHFKYVLAPGDSFASKGLIQLIDTPLKVGNKCELSPVSLGIIEHIYNKMMTNGGSALIIDYGYENFKEFTLQGIRNHKFVNELSSPGIVDLSVHVNFNHFKIFLSKQGNFELIKEIGNIHIHGTTLQSDFLIELDFDSKFSLLLQDAKNEKEVEHLIWIYNKFIHDLGQTFRFFNFSTHSKLPIGFHE